MLIEGKHLHLNFQMTVQLPIDQVFGMIFTESQFYRDWLFVSYTPSEFLILLSSLYLQDPKMGAKIQNLSCSDFEAGENGEETRSLTYERLQSFGFTSATIKYIVPFHLF